MTLHDTLRRLLHSAVPQPWRPAAKAPYYVLRSMLRRLRRTASAPVTQADLIRQLEAAGVVQGDVLCVHGSLSQIGNVAGGGLGVVEALQRAVGPEGTILMPAYGSADQAFAGKDMIDLRTDPAMTGALTEQFRRMPGVRRSSHPFSSVCAWGRQADFVVGGHAEDARICHRNSPLARFRQLGGKVIGIGITLGPVSFYHVVEDNTDDFPLEVYLPPKPVTYIDGSGAQVTRPVARYRPELVRRRIDHPSNSWIRDRFMKDFKRLGIISFFPLGAARAWVISSAAMFKAVHDLARHGVTIYTRPEDAPTQLPDFRG